MPSPPAYSGLPYFSKMRDDSYVRLIGTCEFADVYHGERVRHKTLTAIKVLHARFVQDNLKSFLNREVSFLE